MGGFDESIEVFDVYKELKEYEGLLRYRAQDLGDDEKALMLITDGVRNFVQAASYATLWDPECRLDIPTARDELFLDRDWSQFVDSEEFTVAATTVEDVRVIARTDENEYLMRFRYENGENNGFDMEFVDIRVGNATIRNNAFIALWSPVPAFRGDQLPTVYDKLQAAADVLDFAWQ